MTVLFMTVGWMDGWKLCKGELLGTLYLFYGTVKGTKGPLFSPDEIYLYLN